MTGKSPLEQVGTIYPPLPTPEDENYPLVEPSEQPKNWEVDVFAGLTNDEHISSLDNPYFITIPETEAKPEYYDVTLLDLGFVDSHQQGLTPKCQLQKSQETLTIAIQDCLNSLSRDPSRRPALNHEDIGKMSLKRMGNGLAIPSSTRVADHVAHTFLSDLVISILPLIHGAFGVERLPEQAPVELIPVRARTPEQIAASQVRKDAKRLLKLQGSTQHPLSQEILRYPVESLPLKATPLVDIIKCICTEPNLDNGKFMISCDSCQVWYHGSCVGIEEQVFSWKCMLSTCNQDK